MVEQSKISFPPLNFIFFFHFPLTYIKCSLPIIINREAFK